MSYYIYVVPKVYIWKNDFTKLSVKSLQVYNFSEFTKIQVPIGLVAEEICPTMHFETNSKLRL